MRNNPNITVWNENRHEQDDEEVADLYPEGIHDAIASFLDPQPNTGEVQTATLDEPQHGLAPETLDKTDVLLWWGHIAHEEVDDRIVERVHEKVLEGMGLIVLHSGMGSKIFRRLMGTTGRVKWREDGDIERLWVVNPAHPIASDMGEHIEIARTEMYGEPFDIPAPDELVFISWFPGGEVLRSGCCYYRGRGRVFYFRPGHETYPVYHNDQVLHIIHNACQWAAPDAPPAPDFGHATPAHRTT